MCASTLADARTLIERFHTSRSPLEKVQILKNWVHLLTITLEHLSDGAIDPDLLLFIRGWTFASAAGPNASSQLSFLRDFLLDGLDPEADDFPFDEYPHNESFMILRRTIEAVRSMRNTKDWLVIKVEGGIVANMSQAPPAAMSLLISILAEFQNPVSQKRSVFKFRGTGFATLLEWFARDWELSITEDRQRDLTIVTVENPEEFPLFPHVCEEILLKLSRFTR